MCRSGRGIIARPPNRNAISMMPTPVAGSCDSAGVAAELVSALLDGGSARGDYHGAGQRRPGERNQRAISSSARERRGSRTTSRIPLAVFTRDMIFTAIFRERVVVRKAVANRRVAGGSPTRCPGSGCDPTTGRGREIRARARARPRTRTACRRNHPWIVSRKRPRARARHAAIQTP
jgi:hypothetical protein